MQIIIREAQCAKVRYTLEVCFTVGNIFTLSRKPNRFCGKLPTWHLLRLGRANTGMQTKPHHGCKCTCSLYLKANMFCFPIRAIILRLSTRQQVPQNWLGLTSKHTCTRLNRGEEHSIARLLNSMEWEFSLSKHRIVKGCSPQPRFMSKRLPKGLMTSTFLLHDVENFNFKWAGGGVIARL